MDQEAHRLKQHQAKKLIEKYFHQITAGCGSNDCKNEFCQSSGLLERSLTPNQAAVKAIQLYVEEAKLCYNLDENAANNQQQQSRLPSSNSAQDIVDIEMKEVSNESAHSQMVPSSSSLNMKSSDNHHTSPSANLSTSNLESTHFLDEEILNRMIISCEETKNYAPIIRTLGFIFSRKESVAQSFQRRPKTSVDVILDRVQQPSAIKNMKKEDIRTLEDDEKDQDSMDNEEEKDLKDPSYTSVDFESLSRSFKGLYKKNSQVFEVLDNAIQTLASQMYLDLRLMREREEFEEILTCIVTLFEIFQIDSNMLEQSIVRTLVATTALPIWVQARLAHIWSTHCREGLRSILLILQQIITLQVIANTYHRDLFVNDNETIVNATKVMKILYYANILTSKISETSKYDMLKNSSNEQEAEIEDFSSIVYPVNNSKNAKVFEDPLMNELEISVNECCEPFISFEEFHNEPLCDVIETDEDYTRYRNLVYNDISVPVGSNKKFSFMVHPFILTPVAKTLALFFDSRVKMFTERRTSLFNIAYSGTITNPYLKMKVRRENIIEDTLSELEMTAMTNPKELKKQVFVEFVGEHGIDEGGVSKEFFQLIVEEIFNDDYGMFITNEETQTCWFNSFSFENEAQFTLIGIVLGLAIYNSIILPLNFPMVVYKKLLNVRVSFRDLQEWNPILFNSLKSMLDYTESDMEEVFAQTFEIGYENVFGGAPIKHCLKKDGEKILVNQQNKYEFVELYADFLLNKVIEKQFKAFRKGFRMVTDESPLQLLFRPDEIELLVCGSKNFDFDELEKSTEYEGGYTPDSQIIKDFWSIVHGFTLESKRKLLQFTTGSNRVPVGGLSKLKLVIARHGEDSQRLPTSHTCFNILLLPEYISREKLEERLLKAINYSKGFGML